MKYKRFKFSTLGIIYKITDEAVFRYAFDINGILEPVSILPVNTHLPSLYYEDIFELEFNNYFEI